jgi:hypothetical protein
MRLLLLATVFVGLELSCSRGAAPPTASSLGGEVARVGDVAIPAGLVEAAAQVSGSSPRRALEVLIDDALAAEGARALGVERGQASWATEAALAATIPRRLEGRAQALGPPTDDELATLSVTHAVVLRAPGFSQERAMATAHAITRAVSSARTPEAFEAAASATPHAGAQVVVERISPIEIDGAFDPSFVAAAFRLRAPSEQSPLIESAFGWHVLYLIERKAPDPASLETRRREVASAVVAIRARASIDDLLREKKGRVAIEVSGAADSLMTVAVAKAP